MIDTISRPFREKLSRPSNVPSCCPTCRSQAIVTTAKVPDAQSYWRCTACGDMWNVTRRQSPQTSVRSWR
jgi:predicted Zn finger-like uncharacterized protein